MSEKLPSCTVLAQPPAELTLENLASIKRLEEVGILIHVTEDTGAFGYTGCEDDYHSTFEGALSAALSNLRKTFKERCWTVVSEIIDREGPGTSAQIEYEELASKYGEKQDDPVWQEFLTSMELESRSHLLGNPAQKFEYQLLGRLTQDCEYYLGAGGRNKKHLWALDEAEQIQKMKELYEGLSVKPEWLTLDEINAYEAQMLPEELNDAIGTPDDPDRLEKLNALGFQDEAQYKEHQRVLQASKDLYHKQRAAAIASGSIAFHTVYEVIAAGFCAGADDSDDLVFLVAATSQEEVEAAIQDTGASINRKLPEVIVEDADFILPKQGMALSSVLLEKASDDRNRNRPIG